MNFNLQTIFDKSDKAVSTLRSLVHEKPALTIVAGLVLVGIGTVTVMNIPHAQTYTLEVGPDDMSGSHSLSFDSPNTLGPIKKADGKKYRDFQYAGTSIAFSPTTKLDEDQNIIAQATIQSEKDVRFVVECISCPTGVEKKKYVSKSYTLFSPGFTDYERLDTVGGVNIYGRTKMNLQFKNKKSSKTVEEWLEKNLPYSATPLSLNAIDYMLEGKNHFSRQQINSSPYPVRINFRGDVSFLAYFKDTIDLSVTKQDLNWYDNADEIDVRVSLLGSDADPITEHIRDDGGEKNQLGERQTVRIYQEQIEEGPYLVTIEEKPREGAEKKGDFSIPEVTFNTNKVMVTGNTILSGGGVLYYNAIQPVKIETNAWTDPQIQNLTINDSLVIAEITREDLGQWKKITLPPGQNTLRIDAYLSLNLGNNYFAFDQYGTFEPYRFLFNQTDKPDLLITPIDITNDNAWATVGRSISIKQLLEEWKLPNTSSLTQLRLWLRAADDDDAFSFITQREQEGYTYITAYDTTHIFTKAALASRLINKDVSPETLADWLETHIPVSTAIGIDGFRPAASSFVNSDVGFIPGEYTLFEGGFKTDQSFIGHFEHTINISFVAKGAEATTSSLASPLKVTIFNADNESIKEETFNINGDQTTYSLHEEDIQEGIYTIVFSQADTSSVISRLRVNTNKFVFKDGARFIGPIRGFIDVPQTASLSLDISDPTYAQTVMINDVAYPLKNKNVGKPLTVMLPRGGHALVTERDIEIDFPYLARDQKSFFFPFLYVFEPKSDQDVILIEKAVPRISLSDVSITIK